MSHATAELPAASAAAPAPVLNVSAYRFVDLDDLPARRERLLALCLAQGLKGTVLLAPEGINLFLAGTEPAVQTVLAALRADPALAGLEAKLSYSERQPFGRMKVKIKREIITLRQPLLRPAAGRAPALAAPTLKRWLDAGCDDAGRPLLLLDTRNAFECDHGGFAHALDLRIDRFADFAAAAQARLRDFAGRAVVTYCTGGIRCEKAALWLQHCGVETVYQLDGGILRYFEQVGGAHYRGDCFVFDQRELLGSDLRPTAGSVRPHR